MERGDRRSPRTARLKIAFLGNARRSKGFEVFANLARLSERDDLQFESIGVAAPDTDHLDVSMLARKPSRISMSRQDYLDAVRVIDLVCLPAARPRLRFHRQRHLRRCRIGAESR